MGTLVVSSRERLRLSVLSQVASGKLSVTAAAGLMRVSVRQGRRIWKRYQAFGDEGLTHRLRGRAGNRAVEASVKQEVLALYRERYADFGPTLAAEKLDEQGHKIDHETLRRLLLKEGLWSRHRRRKAHRSRRERKDCLGRMQQMDGSHHDWFEGRRAWCVLMVMIDDATGRTFARFFEGETTTAAMEIFGAYCRKYGLPMSLYVDRDSIYCSDRQGTVEEQLRAQGPATQFGRAMKQLGVELILAHSAQAKGRVERMNGTLQDRLVKELRLAGISELAAANAFLNKTFLPALNRKFMVKASEPADVHRRVPAGTKLDEVLCFQEQRTVSNDWCVSWRNRIFQLDRRHEALGLAGRKVVVREKLDGTIQLLSNRHKLHWRELKERPPRQKPPRPPRNNKPWKPPAAHPWRGVPRAAPAPAPPARRPLAEREEGDSSIESGRVTFLSS
jgi:transposase